MSDASVVKQIADKIKDSSNILVTVNSNPTVDELSAALGITLLINKLDKHGTAVFSGDVPPAIEFLDPKKTFEHTVDSLRDFIIALDKEKADHLRYKVVDDMVKIFITPYRTTINEKDLDFSQGDYNVETVLAIGVRTEQDLDKALQSHGRILHDATVAAISMGEATKLGGIEWADSNASSYSEMLYTLAETIRPDKNIIDEQIANAFLTGIVAATDRFSNAQTTSKVMTIAAQLMAAGANQQLIATKLQEDHEISTPPADNGDLKEGELKKIEPTDDAPEKDTTESTSETGALTISHLPKGDVDEVARAVAEEQSDAALARAEEQLSKHQDRDTDGSHDEAELAAQLSADESPKSTLPSLKDLQADIANARPDGSAPTTPQISPIKHGAVADDQWKARSEQEAEEPTLGGTLNATTEQAEDDKRREIADDRNRTILTHGGTYSSDTPSFQSPLNATTALQQDAEPKTKDIFGEGSETMRTERADAIQPPAPQSAPTLAEIDAKAREEHTDARAAIDAALKAAETASSATTPGAVIDTAQQSSGMMPPLPPLPPMPDFSTLPPLPGEGNGTSTVVPDQLGDVLPPAPVVMGSAASAAPATPDPAQFRIPGQ